MSEAYRKAGVNIEAGYKAVEGMKKHVARTFRPGVLGSLGGFGGLFELPYNQYKHPVLVSGTDGVGTKLKIAFGMDLHDTVGIDLVAMCVNDVVVQGAEPLFFMDYLAAGKVEPDKATAVVSGIAEGCVQAGCALLGGETAEMPGFYTKDEYDLAGFCVGIVEKEQLITGDAIMPGDIILGLASSGLHSNGFSLVRKLLFEDANYDLNSQFGDRESLGRVLLKPTRIYVKPILQVLKDYSLSGMAHITGGGFIENIPRMLPENSNAEIILGSWPVPPIFQLLQREGNLSKLDMYNTFNMGIGMIIVVKPELCADVIECFKQQNETVYIIGKVTEGNKQVVLREGN